MRQIKHIFFIFFFLGLTIQSFFLSADTLRAAIDFGSGAVKIQMAEVNTKENRVISESLLGKYIPISLMEDVTAHNGFISEEMIKKTLTILKGLKEEAVAIAVNKGYNEIQLTGIATAVFRKAHNGYDLLEMFEKQLGICFQILSQQEEGKLGFLSAKILYPDIPEELLLAWDSGNGSFQMSTNEKKNHSQIYNGPLGFGNVRVILSKEIRHGPILQPHESGNPVSKEEAIELNQRIKELLPPIPDWLKKKLNSKNFIATFGDSESTFAIVAQAIAYLSGSTKSIQQDLIYFSDVQRVITAFIGKKDDFFTAAGLHCETLTSAIHLSSIMEYFGIQEIHYRWSIGNTCGMLITPRLWGEYTIHMQNLHRMNFEKLLSPRIGRDSNESSSATSYPIQGLILPFSTKSRPTQL